MCLVAAELFGVSNNGLGMSLWFYYDLHQMDSVVVYMLLLGLIGLFIDMCFPVLHEQTPPALAGRGGGLIPWAARSSAI